MGERSNLLERSQLIEGLAASPVLVERLQQLLDRLDALPPALRGLIRAALESRLDGDLLEFLADYLDEHGLADGRPVRLLRPQKGDVLVVYFDYMQMNTERRESLDVAVAETCRRAGMKCWIVAPHGTDLTTLDPEQLRAAGLVRVEELTRHGEVVRERCARLVERLIRDDLDNYVAVHVRAIPAGP
jgi:hypothetical protein